MSVVADPASNRDVGHIYLRAQRDGPVRGGNPWIFSQAIGRADPASMEPGSPVLVHDIGGDLIGLGYYNPNTTIAVRMLAWGIAPRLEELIDYRLEHAAALRRRVIRGDTDSYRLINGDGDGLSGVVIDRYGEVCVLQLYTAGADRMRDRLIAALAQRFAPRSIIERSQGAVRRQERLENRIGVIAGEDISQITAVENGLRFAVDFATGQKTGRFLDQRENRMLAAQLASGAHVLDAYCYDGGFAMAALSGGARHVTAIDTSARAVAATQRNLELNGFGADALHTVHADAAEFMAATDQRFDLVVLDPPALARSRGDADRAARMYTDLNAMAMRVLAPGGALLTFSCSVHFRGEEFIRAVRIAQAKVKRNLRMIARLGPGPDHPVLLGHIEGEYLTGLHLADL